AQVAEQPRETASLYEEWKTKPEDGVLRAELKKNLAALQKDAGLIADQRLEDSAGKALKALDKTSTMPLTPFLREAIEKITAAAAPSPSPEAAKLIDASAEAIDAELLGVYLEESDEVLATIREHLDTVREQHANKEALTTIRRGFHTLKGSGRMVGLMRLGEAAWAVEQTMNAWVQEERAATPALLQLIGLAHEYFSDNVKRLKAGGVSSDERSLVVAAERVRRGEATEQASHEAPGASTVPAAEPAASARAEFAPAAAALVPVAPAEPEEFVQLGEHRVSTTLFAIFSGEARAHVIAIREEHEDLRQDGVVGLRVARGVPKLVARLERVGEEAGVSQESTTHEEREPPSQSPPSREAENGVSEALTETEEGDSSLDELDLDITLERRQRRLDDDIDPELLQIFIDEAQELVPSVGSAMRDWRDNPDNAALGQALQRVLHTLKGSARMAGAMALGELTHHMETRVENAMSVKTLPTALFAELETSWDRMGILFEQLQKPRAPEEGLPAMAVAS